MVGLVLTFSSDNMTQRRWCWPHFVKHVLALNYQEVWCERFWKVRKLKLEMSSFSLTADFRVQDLIDEESWSITLRADVSVKMCGIFSRANHHRLPCLCCSAPLTPIRELGACSRQPDTCLFKRITFYLIIKHFLIQPSSLLKWTCRTKEVFTKEKNVLFSVPLHWVFFLFFSILSFACQNLVFNRQLL